MKKQLKILVLVFVMVVSVGCVIIGEWDYSELLYLCGQFVWWDVLLEYKVKKVEFGLYWMEVKLKVDGQFYEFKFGDVNWSFGINCGYLLEKDDEIVILNNLVNVNCLVVFENF